MNYYYKPEPRDLHQGMRIWVQQPNKLWKSQTVKEGDDFKFDTIKANYLNKEDLIKLGFSDRRLHKTPEHTIMAEEWFKDDVSLLMSRRHDVIKVIIRNKNKVSQKYFEGIVKNVIEVERELKKIR